MIPNFEGRDVPALCKSWRDRDEARSERLYPSLVTFCLALLCVIGIAGQVGWLR